MVADRVSKWLASVLLPVDGHTAGLCGLGAVRAAPTGTVLYFRPARGRFVGAGAWMIAMVCLGPLQALAYSLHSMTCQSESIPFESASARLAEAYLGRLEAMAGTLHRDVRASVMIVGHTDARGSRFANRRLGWQRALAIRSALIALHVPSSRMRVRSAAGAEPVDPGADEPAWAKNRRAEIRLCRYRAGDE